MAIPPPHKRVTSTPYWWHCAVQGAAFLVAACLTAALCSMQPPPSTGLTAPILAGAIALALASALGFPWWWKLIHSFFLPATALALSAKIPSEWYLGAFVFLFLVFRSATTGRIPLYFSGKHTTCALVDLLGDMGEAKFVDLGAGIGSVTCRLARALPRCDITGVENSAIPWLLGRIRAFGASNHHWIFGNFWHVSLDRYDVVYAFLSPAPMAKLWEKAQKEMRPSCLFITNTFRCPGVEPTFIIAIEGRCKTELYCYAIPVASSIKPAESPCAQRPPLLASDLKHQAP